MSSRHAIAAGHALTAEAGSEVLAAGGTAVDAAVAAAFTAMVAEPVLAGLLGGGFAMVRTAGGETHLLDAFVQTPRRRVPDARLVEIEADFGTVRQAFHIGAGAVAVPGLAAGLAEAHARFGRIALPELVAPAVRAGREGVRVTAYQALLGRIVAPILSATPAAQAIFCEGEAPLPEGALFRNPELAEVLEVMALEGPRFVQEGEVAAGLLALSGTEGGHLSAEDLRRYAPRWRRPLSVRRGDARIALNPPPSLGGALVAFALEMAPHRPTAAEMAASLAATVRARLEADLDREPHEGAERLLSPALLARYRAEATRRPAATRGTTHISAVDASGLGVSLTLSNGEGCGLIVPGTGIMPNNMMGESDLLPNGLDLWEPDRRLASMMAPLAVAWPDGRVAMLGSGGSNRIRSALAQVLVRLIDEGLGLDAAIRAARLHVEGAEPPALDFEEAGLAEAERAALLEAWPEARGWTEPSMFFGGAHGVMREAKGAVTAAGDPRRDGHARTG